MKVKKVGTQISGGSTNLGRSGKAGTKAGAGTGSSKSSLGYTAMVNRNLAKMSATMSGNLSRGAHGA